MINPNNKRPKIQPKTVVLSTSEGSSQFGLHDVPSEGNPRPGRLSKIQFDGLKVLKDDLVSPRVSEPEEDVLTHQDEDETNSDVRGSVIQIHNRIQTRSKESSNDKSEGSENKEIDFLQEISQEI